MESSPLSITLNTHEVKSAFPIVAEGAIARWRLKSIGQEEVDRKDKPGTKGVVIKFEFDLVSQAPSTDGEPINPGEPGSKFFRNIQCYAKDDAKDKQWYVKAVNALIDGLLGTGDPGNSKNRPARPEFGPQLVPQLIGREIDVKMRVSTYEGQSRNEFGTIWTPGELSA